MIIRALIFLLISSCCYQTAFAGKQTGTFFNVTSNGGAPTPLSMAICLNGAGPLSCQNYTTSTLNFNIVSTIPNHTYPQAGIKITTPGYTLSGCTMNSNGYCIFSASTTQPTAIQSAPSSCLAGSVVFNPTTTQLNNPTGGTSNPPQQFTVNMNLCNSQGRPIFPSATNPINVAIYGAPTGAITPTTTTTTTGTVTFNYSGQSFPNNILLNAWITDSTNNGAALGVTQILQQNTPPTCTLGANFYDVPLAGTLPDALQVTADVGYNVGSSSSNYKTFTIDTGSLGVIVPLADLPQNANVIGPGAVGVKYYDSSGNTYSGHYYLAPVRIQTYSSTVQTQPIMVLAIDKAYCTGPTTKSCYSNPPTPNLHYLGVGFNRDGTTGGDLFTSPEYNAFLHLTNTNNGTDITPGYYLTPNDSGAVTGLRLGISSNTGYNLVSLSPNPAVPGDFLPQSGCFSFPSSPAPNQFCGTALLDVGIDYMFIDLPFAQRPAGTFDSNNLVPAGVGMEIIMGSLGSPALNYSFNAVNGSPPPPFTATPTQVQWIDNPTIFVNTGRRPLYIYNYLYNGQCGFVGFKSI